MAERDTNGTVDRRNGHVCDECAARLADLEAELVTVRGHAAAAAALLAAVHRS